MQTRKGVTMVGAFRTNIHSKRIKNICSYLIIFSLFGLFIYSCQIAPMIGESIRQEHLADGVYEGSYRSGPNSAKVKVTITEGKIVNIELVEHFSSWIGQKVDNIIQQRIILKQSTRVDAVTGATNSSRVIMNAVQIAVEKAYK